MLIGDVLKGFKLHNASILCSTKHQIQNLQKNWDYESKEWRQIARFYCWCPIIIIIKHPLTYYSIKLIGWYNFGQLTAFSIVVDLWSGHPNTLNDLEHRRSNHNEDEQCYKLWRYRVLLLFLRCFTNITTFGNVLLVLFISLFHSWRGRHFDFVYWCLWKIYVKHKWFWKKWVYIRFKARCLKVSCWISDMLCRIVETKPI